MQRCQLAVPQQLWAHDVLSVCLWVNPRGRPGRRDRCEICDECKGQEERRGPEGFTKTSTIRLYRRCLADASDSVMWSFRRLQGNMLTCLRSCCFERRQYNQKCWMVVSSSWTDCETAAFGHKHVKQPLSPSNKQISNTTWLCVSFVSLSVFLLLIILHLFSRFLSWLFCLL